MPQVSRRSFFLLSCAIVSATTPTIQAQSAAKSFDSRPAQTAPAAIDREVRADMAFLADDDLHGRGSATRDEHIAALFAASQFQSLGLEPGGPNGSYLQKAPLPDPLPSRLQQNLPNMKTLPAKRPGTPSPSSPAQTRSSRTRSSCSPPTSTISA